MISPASVAVENVDTLDRCESCEHPRSQHDPLSLRWCAATKLGVGSRACVCSGSARSGRGASHY